MKVIRRSPVARVTAWLLTLALIAPILFVGRAARAQDQQILRVIIADIVNRTPKASANLGVNSTAALQTELANAGLGKFNVASTTEVRNEAISLGIKVPSNPSAPSNFTDADLVRIAKSLNADAILSGEVGSVVVPKGKPAAVGLIVKLQDVAAGIPINGGSAVVSAAIRPGEPLDIEEQFNRAIADAAQDTVRQVVQRQVPTGTVLNIQAETVILNRGIRDGYHNGDHVTILREGANGSKTKEGEVLIRNAYATDSEAVIVSNIGGIQPEDLTRVFYTPPIKFVFAADGIHTTPTARGPAFSMAAIGGTIGVIALGVLVSQAVKGGQQSITDITAEPNSTNNIPGVLVRWRDNIFGQSGVQQYKIYRQPDFPFGGTEVSSGTGGGGTTTTAQVIPVDVVPNGVYSYTDLPSPHTPYTTGILIDFGGSNGGLGSQGASGGGQNGGTGSSTSTGGAFAPTPINIDTGFTAGRSYEYWVTAIIARSIPSSGSTNGTGGGVGGGTGGGTGGGGTGGGGTGGGGSGTTGGIELIETDPAKSQQATPITPIILVTPTEGAGSVNAKAFQPTWNSRIGADVYVLEISTDRNFKNPALIFQVQVISTSSQTDGVPQSVTAPIDLTTIPQLLADPTGGFPNFVAQSTATPTPPQIFWRVGARNDGDVPGPVHWISGRAGDPDRSFRYVYDSPNFFTPAPLPPPPPGSKAALELNKRYASGSRAGMLAPQPGDTGTTRAQSKSRVLSPQEIITGGTRRRN